MPDDNDAVQRLIDQMPTGGTLTLQSRFNIDPRRPVRLKSYIVLKLDVGAELAAIPVQDEVATPLGSSCLAVIGCGGTKILGPGKIIGNRLTHGGNDWQKVSHGINISGSQDIALGGGLIVEQCWGDGVIVGTSTSRNISVDSINCSNNRRQGLSTIDVDGMTILNSVFRTNGGAPNGTAPGCGIDIEPSEDVHLAFNLRVAKCIFEGNIGSNVAIGGPKGQFKNIIIESSNVYDRHTQPIWVSGKAGKLGEPLWATALSVFKGQSWYRWWGYPNEWRSA